MKTNYLLILMALMPLFLANCSSDNSEKYPYKIGDNVEDFKLKNIDGNMVSMSDYDFAKGFIIIFTCNHCPYSVAYEDRIIELTKFARDKSYELIAINPNDPELYPEDSYENMIIRSEKKSFNFPYLFDADQKIYPKFGATKTPHVFIVRKQSNELNLVYKGAIDDNHEFPENISKKYVETVIMELSEGKTKLSHTETKAIGCSIKDKSKE